MNEIEAIAEVEQLIGHMAEPELPSWLLQQIGPRQIGGRYLGYYWNEPYDVVDIQVRRRDDGSHDWSISVRGQDGRIRTHCTAWDHKRDTVISQPQVLEAENSPQAIRARTCPDSRTAQPTRQSQPRVDS